LADKIYSLSNEGTLESIDKEPYPTEYDLQSLLERHPDLLAGDQIDEANPRRWLLVSREFGVPEDDSGSGRWYLDHLFLDQDAIPTLVEVKLRTNNDSRRKVVGQMLDYAANSVAYWPIESLRNAFDELCNETGKDPSSQIRELIQANPDELNSIEIFWNQVRTNLQAGRIRLLFVADEIPRELQKIVEFLSRQMSPAEVLAVELRQYKNGKITTLVPRVIGQTAAEKKPTTIGKWDEASFFRKLKITCSLDVIKATARILNWAKEKSDEILWGSGGERGSFAPMIENRGSKHSLFAVKTNGVIETYFYYLKLKPPFDDVDLRKELMRKLNEIPEINLPADAVDRGPIIPLSIFNEDALERFLLVFNWVIEQIRKR